jgi:hypothetical protein
MAGKIVADTLEHSTAGSIATNYVVEGSAKAWFNLNAATPALRDSFNIASITDEDKGRYEGNFTSAMGNGDYSANGSSTVKGSSNSFSNILTTGDPDNTYGLHTTSAIRANVYAYNASDYSDPQMLQVTVHGDLA